MITLVLAFAASLQAQYVPQPYQPYVQPNPWAVPSYHQPHATTPQAPESIEEPRR